MKLNINVLIEGKLNFYNLLFSNWSILFENLNFFKDQGLNINFFTKDDDCILDCDVLILSSRFFYNNNFTNKYIIKTLERFNKKNSNIIWFDLRDSAGTTQFEIMPYIKLYVKNQVYKDFSKYKINLYGGRMYSEFYHNEHKINDTKLYKMQSLQKKDYKKLIIGWNLGVIRYDYLNNLNFLKKIYYKNINYKKFLNIQNIKYKKNFHNKNYRVFSVFNSKFDRETIEYQRKLALKKLRTIKNNNDLYDIKLNKIEYLNKIKSSKYVLSCYGWGEICYRDWEAVINNSLILKPDMSNIETWPNIYENYKTYIPLSWDLSNLQYQLERLESNFFDIEKINTAAFDVYKSIRSNDYFFFRKRFLDIIKLTNV
jgi:hypothetical protein